MSGSRPPDLQPSSTISANQPSKSRKTKFKPKRYHAYNVVLFIFGSLFPPLAVAARFGVGSDFWLNLLLTLAGYIPGHAHNFYIQNIRNNKNHKRTPKWAIRYRLVDDSEIRRKERRSQWAGRYNDRLPNSSYENHPVEEGQIPDRTRSESTSVNGDGNEPHLWEQREEHFYGESRDPSGSVSTGGGGGRWHYPANFEDAEVDDPSADMELASSAKKHKGLLGGKKKKDRWALSEDARRGAPVPDGEYVGERKKKKKEKKVKRRKKGGDGVGDDDSEYNSRERAGSISRSELEEPEDPVGGLYGERRAPAPDPAEQRDRADQELFEHQF